MSSNKRIIFLDIMRAFAVLMMVQGHTTDALLANSYRTYDSVFFTLWENMRGFTAPIFMFTSGTVFTYLFKLNKLPFKENPRVVKGFKRFLLLVFIGYILRYPTWRIIDFSYVRAAQWKIFFGVDALHLIGFGLLFIILLAYLGEKIKLNYFYISATAALLFFVAYPFTLQVNWTEILPTPAAAYFTRSTGSLFPFFPWAGYVIAGSVLGNYLARNEGVQRTAKFPLQLFIAAIILIAVYLIGNFYIEFIQKHVEFFKENAFTAFFRLGIVLLLNSAAAFVSLKIERLPKLVAQIGRNTLLIYAVHLVILYGSAWNQGLYQHIAKQLSIGETLFAVAVMISSMILMVYAIEKIKAAKKKYSSEKGILADEKV